MRSVCPHLKRHLNIVRCAYVRLFSHPMDSIIIIICNLMCRLSVVCTQHRKRWRDGNLEMPFLWHTTSAYSCESTKTLAPFFFFCFLCSYSNLIFDNGIFAAECRRFCRDWTNKCLDIYWKYFRLVFFFRFLSTMRRAKPYRLRRIH